MSKERWGRLAADLQAAGYDVKVDALGYPGGVSRSITFPVPGYGLVEVHDRWWSKNASVWTGWEVHAESRDSIVVRGSVSRWTKKRSEVVAAFGAALTALKKSAETVYCRCGKQIEPGEMAPWVHIPGRYRFCDPQNTAAGVAMPVAGS